MLKNYWLVMKPWIVFANLISAAAGFFLAAQGRIDLAIFFPTMIGISCIVASGCVFNNYIDRNIDLQMDRTRHRALANQRIPLCLALAYAATLGTTGVTILLLKTNALSTSIAVLGFAVYVCVYSLYLKRNSIYSTVVGSLAGAAPPLAAYCCVRNQLDLEAIILLAIFSLWQIPHSYAITIFRYDDYAAAAIPVMPVKSSIHTTKKLIIYHIAAFILTAQMLTVFGYTGYAYFIVVTAFGLYWLYTACLGYKASADRIIARKLYIFSIITIFMLSVMMSIDFARPPLPRKTFFDEAKSVHLAHNEGSHE